MMACPRRSQKKTKRGASGTALCFLAGFSFCGRNPIWGVADKKKMALILNDPSAKSAFALGSGQ